MRAIASTLLRGLLGVVATVALVAAVWAGYMNRDALAAALRPVVDRLPASGPAASDTGTALGTPSPPRAVDTAPGAPPLPGDAAAVPPPESEPVDGGLPNETPAQ